MWLYELGRGKKQNWILRSVNNVIGFDLVESSLIRLPLCDR
jgi:hypothetical protein